MTRADCLKLALFASSALSALPAVAGDRLPVGGSVAHGKVDISTPAAGAMAIRQSSQTAIVNWQGFSIGEGARVDIRQPSAASAMLNRVTGKTPSSIAGQLNANGQVYLVNPNGIAITPSGTVKTGAFVASTLATSDEDFIAGRRSFRGGGASAGVVNRGAIEVGKGGYAALIGGRVDNSGTISAPLGRIGLGAGERATLDLTGDGFLQIAEPSADDGDDTPLISQSGRLTADGGRVEIKAATARQMAREVVNLSGVVQARSVSGRSGAIVLGGGAGGKVRVTGRLDASAPRAAMPASIDTPPARPGAITVTGRTIELAGARLDASGPAGGGTVRVGGDWQGKGTLQRAETTTVDAATTIAADALVAGDGGSVVVWSDERTAFAGHISARGGPEGGDGGAAEVSGKARLTYTGFTDLSAPQGAFGTLLLDPSNIIIDFDGSTTGDFVPPPDDDDDDDTGCCEVARIDGPDRTFVPSQADSLLVADELLAQLETANIVVSTASEDEAAGNITVAAPLQWTSGALLTLTTVGGDITIDATIDAGDNGGLTTSTAGTTAVNAAVSVGADGSLTMTSGPLLIKAPITIGERATLNLDASGEVTIGELLSLGANSSATITGGTGVNLVGTATLDSGSNLGVGSNEDITLSGDVTGSAASLTVAAGGTIVPTGAVDVDTFILSNGAWIQVGDPLPAFSAVDFRIADGEGASFLRAREGNGSGEAPYLIVDVYGLQGIGSSMATGDDLPDLADTYALANDIDASGTANWRQPERDDSGFDPIQGGEEGFTGVFQGNGFRILDLSMSQGEQGTGLFSTVGTGGEVDNVVITNPDIWGGGLVGSVAARNEGTITRVRVDGGSVHGYTQVGEGTLSAVGAIVGLNLGSVRQSLSTASVTGRANDDGTISAGGLVGQNGEGLAGGTVSDSYGAGPVQVDQAGNAAVGGLVGSNAQEGRILRSYAMGNVSLGADAGFRVAGGLVGDNLGSVDQTYATGQVAGTGQQATLGGLVGGTLADEPGVGPVFSSFWDTTTTGQTQSEGGGTGLTTARFQDTLSFMALADAAGWSFTDVWAPSSTGFYPELYSLSPVVWLDIADATATYRDAPAFAATPSGGPDRYAFGPDGDLPDLTGTLSADGYPAGGVGTYTITTSAESVVGAGDIDYRIVSSNGTLTVNPRALSVVANSQSKIYGDTLAFIGTEYTTAGLVAGDTVDSATLASSGAAAGARAGNGPFAITASNAVGTGLLNPQGVANYTITYGDGIMSITPRPLSIPVGDRSKTYGDTVTFAGSEFLPPSGLVNGDTVTSVSLTSLGAPATANVAGSPYAIRASAATGTGLVTNGVANYAITYGAGDLTVTPRPLTIRAADRNKTYGQTVTFAGNEFTSRGLVNGDTVRSVSLTSLGAPGTANVAGSPYAITASAATGTGLVADGIANYAITYQPGTLTVAPAPLVITADDQVKLFGRTFTFDGTEFTTRGLVDGDRVLSALLRSDGAPSTALVSRDPYRIDISDAVGTGLSFDGVANYDISYVPGEMLVVPFDPSVLPTYNAGLRLVYYTQLPNPDDVIEIADTEGFGTGGGGGGPLLAPVRATGLTLARQTAQDALTFVESISDRLERRVAECDPVRPDPDAYLNCVSDALSRYANELDGRILDLPEPLRRVSAVIRDSAREIEGVRADTARRLALATTDAEREAIARDAAARAAAAMQTAVDEIRSAIQLIRAEDDPQLASLETRQGEAITAALQNVGDELTRAVGL